MTVMIVGSLNREAPYFQGARGPGLSVYSFEEDTAETTLVAEFRGVDNPTYLSVSPNGRHIYANSEVFGWAEGLVGAIAFDAATARLRPINTQPTLGSIAAYNTIDATGRFLLVANYGMGAEDDGPNQAVVVLPIRADGGLGAPVSSVALHGQGPRADRQERSHAHCVRMSPDNRFAAVADLGLDALITYPFDERTGVLGEPVRTALPEGSGPRHILFHADGALACVTCELNSTVLSLGYDAADGRFRLLDMVPTVPADTVENHCADLQFHPSGRFLYVSNRGHDSIAVIAVEAATGRLTTIGTTPCGGATPRGLAVDRSGRFLLSANQNGDGIAVFRMDAETGALSEARPPIAHGTPMCIKFARVLKPQGVREP